MKNRSKESLKEKKNNFTKSKRRSYLNKPKKKIG